MASTSSHQVSCGGVVFKRANSSFEVCLIGRRRDGEQVWCLPKGHMEAGEKHEETALREVREETGVTGDLLEPIRKIGYSFYEPKTRQHISKTVHFFLIEYKNGSFDDHDDEVECASWFPLEEALRRAVYEGERDVLKQAETQLKRLK